MKTTHILGITALALSAAFTSCSNYAQTDTYKANQIGYAQETVTGTIVSIQPVQIEANDANMGTAVGGVAGGLAGAMLGGGNAKYATGAGGVILGAIAGNQIDKATSTRDALRISVKLDNSKKTVSVVQLKDKRMSFWVGQSVQVLMGGNGSRVIPN